MKTNLSILCSFVLAAGCSTQRAPDAPLASNDPALTSSNVHSSANSPQGSSAGHVTTTETSTTSRAARTTDSALLPAATTDSTTVTTSDRNVNADGSRTGLPSSNTPANGVVPATPVGGGPHAPDNTGVNARDRNGQQLTPMDQGGSESDRSTTQKIRQAVVGDKGLSFTAKNVKIITVNGRVTLRGPVNSAAERASIEAKARDVAGAQVDNQLEVKP